MRATRILLKGGGNSKIIFSLENTSFEQRAEQTGVICMYHRRGRPWESGGEAPSHRAIFMILSQKKESFQRNSVQIA